MTVEFTAPTLETARLRLRAPKATDAAAHAAFYASARAGFVGGPISAELAWRALAQEAGHWVLHGFGRWVLTEKDDDTPLGIVGLWYPVGFPEHELGWDLFDGATGKGYATEAAQAARQFAYQTLGWTTLTSLIDPANTASAAVATRLGARFNYDFTHERFGPMQVWRHPSPEALS